MNVFKPDWTQDRNGLGDCFAPRSRPSDGARAGLHASRFDHYRGPSHSFLNLTRNTALESPTRFEPTVKGSDDVVI